MTTPNFNLPLINGASPIAIVNDLNSLANAVDSAMGTLATQGDISAVRQIATNANAAANSANAVAQSADGKATTANNAAVAAQGTADKANSTAAEAKNTADAANASVATIMANKVTTISLGTATPSSSLATSGAITASVSKSASSNIALITINGSSFNFAGGWSENLTMPVKLPEALRPANEQHYDVFIGWFASGKPLFIEVNIKPTGDVVVLVHPHGVTDNYSFTACHALYMVGA
nr:MAG TPA: hypothetical protein [Caudoviricetes sp.]